MKDLRTEVLGVRLSKKEFEMLNQVCKTLQIRKSDFIRNLIWSYLNDR